VSILNHDVISIVPILIKNCPAGSTIELSTIAQESTTDRARKKKRRPLIMLKCLSLDSCGYGKGPKVWGAMGKMSIKEKRYTKESDEFIRR
jgi:hypothetical protein